MKNPAHQVACAPLTKEMFDMIIADAELNSDDIHLISPLGNIVMLGDIDKIEYSEENGVWEYTFLDAGETVRYITFIGGVSDYGVLMNSNGFLRTTTGMTPPENHEKTEWQDWYHQELGMKTASRAIH